MRKKCECSHKYGGGDNLQMRIIANAVIGLEGKIICQMEKSANAVTSIVAEIIYKWEKLRMRSQVSEAEDNLQMEKSANAVTSIEQR